MELIDIERNKKIADNIVKYLKSRLMANQVILEKSSHQNKITLNDFVEKTIEVYNHMNIIEDDNPIKGELSATFYDLVEYSDYIILTEEEIDELLYYVERSIKMFGVCKNEKGYSESELVKYSIYLLEMAATYHDGYSEDEKKKIEKWANFARFSKNIGFCDSLSGRISYKENGKEYFSLKNHNKKDVFSVFIDGEVSNENTLENEELLIADNIYLGYILEGPKRTFTIFYKKEVDGENQMKVLFSDDTIYPISAEIKEGYVWPIAKFNQGLVLLGLNHFTQEAYDEHMLEFAMECYNHVSRVKIEKKKKNVRRLVLEEN